MRTITAKELRDNLGDYLKRSKTGESIAVSYRSEVVAIVTPPKKGNDYYGGAEVGKRLHGLIDSLPQSISPMLQKSNKTYKELRDELYRRDPKYRRYLSKEDKDK